MKWLLLAWMLVGGPQIEAPRVKAPEVPMILGWDAQVPHEQVLEINFISYCGASVIWTEQWIPLGEAPGTVDTQIYSTFAERDWRWRPPYHQDKIDVTYLVTHPTPAPLPPYLLAAHTSNRKVR